MGPTEPFARPVAAQPRNMSVGCLREIHYVMGTLLEITLQEVLEEDGRRLLRRAFQEARRLEDLFSTHDDASEISRLNRHAGRGPTEISQELWSALALSLRLASATEGALDITIGPLIDLWNSAEEKGTPPSSDSILEARNRTGISKVRLLAVRSAELTEPRMRLDLGGIGKGYAVDRLKELLIQDGVESGFINFGRSSLAAIGSPPEQAGWPVLIDGGQGEPVGLLHLRDQSLSASGTFRRTFDVKKTRYGHLIDPRDGSSLPHEALGVAVARTGAEAEALTKALVILGRAKGLAVVERFPTAEGLLFSPHEPIASTPGFAEAVHFISITHEFGGPIR
jgi:thiamine biosynthesis lipoprotein